MFALSVISAGSEVLSGIAFGIGYLSTRQKKKIQRHTSLRSNASTVNEGKGVDVQIESVEK